MLASGHPLVLVLRPLDEMLVDDKQCTIQRGSSEDTVVVHPPLHLWADRLVQLLQALAASPLSLRNLEEMMAE